MDNKEKIGKQLNPDELEQVSGGSQINAISGPGSIFGCFTSSVDPAKQLEILRQQKDFFASRDDLHQ